MSEEASEGESSATWYDNFLKEKEDRYEVAKNSKLKILDALREKGVSRVTVTYSGSGDSGEIEDVIAVDAGGNRVDIGSGRWTDGTLADFNPADLSGMIYKYCYEMLEHHFGGWEINEGSYGEITLLPGSRRVLYSHNQRIESVENHEGRF